MIPFAVTQVLVFRSDGSVLLNEMTVNVPHVSSKGHSLICRESRTWLLMEGCIFIEAKVEEGYLALSKPGNMVWACPFGSDPRDQPFK